MTVPAVRGVPSKENKMTDKEAARAPESLYRRRVGTRVHSSGLSVDGKRKTSVERASSHHRPPPKEKSISNSTCEVLFFVVYVVDERKGFY